MAFGFSYNGVSIPTEEVEEPFFGDHGFPLCKHGVYDSLTKPPVNGIDVITEDALQIVPCQDVGKAGEPFPEIFPIIRRRDRRSMGMTAAL